MNTLKKFSLPILTIGFLLFSTDAFAQFDSILESGKSFITFAKKLYPIVAVAGFIILFLMNIGLFFGENADIKKGLFKILIFVVAIIIGQGVILWLDSITL